MLAGCSNSEAQCGGCYTHTDSRKSNMLRLLHHCLLAVCLAGSLMLLPLCCAGFKLISEYEYDSTPLPDYDYNATFDYTFFSNSSTEDLEIFFREKESEDGLDISPTDTESTVSTYPSKAFRTVYPSLVLVLILAAHQLLRLL
ncbi:hypothetical protein PHYPO_G00134660 [Pangasianodon hypophthalmus]|uniref:Uncharacterized protein n=1 Tax=Pangasianodon hypophthalmus TaxID=310915 RepID=A0A5N5KKJ6_PANHP|nr:hypothetical protein PHYPO_G00134660 [Pangasianodon hypophthalmus]